MVLTDTIGALIVPACYDADCVLGDDAVDDEELVEAMWLDDAGDRGDEGGADDFCFV